MVPWAYRRWFTGPFSGGTAPAAHGTAAAGIHRRPDRVPPDRLQAAAPGRLWAAVPGRRWAAASDRPGHHLPIPAAVDLAGAADFGTAPPAEEASTPEAAASGAGPEAEAASGAAELEGGDNYLCSCQWNFGCQSVFSHSLK